MIKIEKVETHGWEAAIRGMRNPMDSWDKSDSRCEGNAHVIGKNDFKLMQQLASAGSDHGKFMRMIVVYMDITAPLYFLKEFDTYKIGTVANSCSTMHKLHDKELTLDDFSHEHLTDGQRRGLQLTVEHLNVLRDSYKMTNDKEYWYQLIQLLPSSYNQKRTVMLNYEVLKNIYHARKNHKLDEWHDFCNRIERLPYSQLITGEE